MKTLKLLALGSALLGATQITQGGVLLGFNSFKDSTDPLTPEDSQPGWSGSISGDRGRDGGSTDGFYGKDWDQPGIGHLIYNPLGVANESNGRIDNGNGTIFRGTAGTAGAIDALLFDAVSTGDATTFNVSWTFWETADKSGPTVPGGTGSATGLTLIGDQNDNQDYEDFALDLGSFFLPVGGYFEIVWNATAGQTSFNLDNIALVPEPGSMLGLGCLVGFGTLLRSRRRTGPAVIA
jgi:hypothetical protein